MESVELTAPTSKQEAFCQEFAASRSIARAYRVAYNPRETMTIPQMHREGRKIYAIPRVRDRIDHLMNVAAADTVTTIANVANLFYRIFEADPNELMALRIGACRYCNGHGHAYHWRLHEYVAKVKDVERLQRKNVDVDLPDPSGGLDYDATAAPHPDCPECHGEGVNRIVPQDTENLSPSAKLLYGGVKYTKEGPQIIIADRMKALEAFMRTMGGFKDNTDVNIRAAAAVVTTASTDPAQAAKTYMEMIGRMSS